MNQVKALKLALEYLEGIHPGNMTPMAEEYWNKAITAIKAALAAPVQEPDKRECMNCAAFGECHPNNDAGRCGYESPAAPVHEPVAIKWEKDADKQCGYNNWVGTTPFGRILITWKGWKDYPDACVDDFPGEFHACGSPDDVKEACEAEYLRRVSQS